MGGIPGAETQFIVNSKPWECDGLALLLKLLWKTGWWQSISSEMHRKLKLD